MRYITFFPVRPRQAAAILSVCACFAHPAAMAQEVAEIPFWHAPEGTAALGGGLRFGQSPYLASDSDDERRLDLVPLYL